MDSSACSDSGRARNSPPPAAQTWKRLRLGGGGWVTGLQIAPNDDKIVRTDAHGAYVRSAISTSWTQVVTKQSMPTPYAGAQSGAGVYEVVFAPSNPQILYMAYSGVDRNKGAIFRSSNFGAAWIQTAFTPVFFDANDPFRFRSYKMAVDPANSDVVYFGSPHDGVFFTADGGATWTAEPDVGTSTLVNGRPPGHTIVFDASSGTTNGRTNRILISTHGVGVYESTDAGANWALTTGGPLGAIHMVCDPNGKIWATRAGTFNNIYSYSGGAWSNRTYAREYQSIAIEPGTANRVVVADGCGLIDQTFNGGTTWTGLYQPGFPVGTALRSAPGMEWLAWTKEDCMSNGNMQFDSSGALWFAMGVGVCKMDPPDSFVGYTWTFDTFGIEELVTNWCISPPGGKPIISVWDRGAFRIDDPEVCPSVHGPNRNLAIIAGWSVDYAPEDPSFIVGLFNYFGGADQSSYSTDGGVSWARFATFPPFIGANKIGGSIAAGSKDSFVWFPSNNGNPYRTHDRGATWTQIAMPAEVPTSGITGWGPAYSDNRHIVTADKVLANTFYAYNSSTPGIYRSTDGGVSWARVYSSALSGFYSTKLRSVPGKSGHLFITGYTADGVASSPFPRSTDGGETWSNVPNVIGVFAFGFGKAATGQDYPAIGVIGSVNGVKGIWKSEDNCNSWLQISDEFPLGRLDLMTFLNGDADIYGRWYLGFRGSGCAYLTDA